MPTLRLPIAGGSLRLRAYGLEAEGAARGRPAHIGIQLSLEMHRGLRVLRALESTTLTPQQCRIAFAHWQGKSTSEIRAQLAISPGTLKSYQKDLYSRLDVNSASELVALLETKSRSVTFNLRRHLPSLSR